MIDKDDNLVWYVCYGSNLLEERFKTYIEGGLCKYNGRTYKGCNDKTLPKGSKPVMIPYDMYLGNNSSSWDGSVSFLDITKKGKAYGRAYLVTKEQFEKLWSMEGKGSNWYNKKIDLDAIDGIPAFTFTNERILPFSSVSYKYMYVLAMGLMETYPDMTNAETSRYLKSIIR